MSIVGLRVSAAGVAAPLFFFRGTLIYFAKVSFHSRKAVPRFEDGMFAGRCIGAFKIARSLEPRKTWASGKESAIRALIKRKKALLPDFFLNRFLSHLSPNSQPLLRGRLPVVR